MNVEGGTPRRTTREKCTATSKQTGLRCGRYPAPGATVCRFHGGSAPQVRAATRRRLLAAQAGEQLAALGVHIETTPVEALEALLWEAAGNVAVLREMIGPLGPPLIDEQGPGGAHKTTAHPLVTLYNEERDRLAKLSEACVKLGLDERRVQLAEVQVERLFTAVNHALAAIPAEHTGPFRAALAAQLRATTETA